MRVEELKDNLSKFAEKSRVAWQHYQKILNREQNYKGANFEDFLKKYPPMEEAQVDIEENPFLNFKLDHEKLRTVIWNP